MPRIGLLSDSHGRAQVTAQAVQLLLAQRPQLLIHLGDVGSVEVLEALLAQDDQGQIVPVHLVFGNTDMDRAELARHAQRLGLVVDHPIGRMQLPEGELIFLHGDDELAMARILAKGPRWLCHGHTHRATDLRRGAPDKPTRVINPGALYRAAVLSVALLDTQEDRLSVLAVPRS